MKSRELKKVVSTLAAVGVLLTGGIAVSAPASAETVRTQIVASVATSVPNTVASKKTRKCVLAIKREKAAKHAFAVARNGGTFAQFVAARDRSEKATAVRKKACRVAKPAKPTDPRVPGVVVPGDASTTYTNDVNDPRPWNWTRPADGSGYGGSNYLGRGSVMTMTNCPATFTVSDYMFGLQSDYDGRRNVYAGVSYQNFSARDISVHVEMDVVDGNGQYFAPYRDGDLQPPSRTMVSETKALRAWTVNAMAGTAEATNNKLQGAKILAVRVVCL